MAVTLVVLASGRGSNFAAIADALDSGTIRNARLAALITNKRKCAATERAKERGIPVEIVASEDFVVTKTFDRAKYEAVLHNTIAKYEPDLLCLAGYTLLLGKALLDAWPGKIINIHPSLLPAFKGLRAQQQALSFGAKITGCTVHFVTEQLDEGPIIAQKAIEILDSDSVETLTARLLQIEHQTYVEALDKLCSERFG